jgi:hypothetical protein
MLKQSRFFRPVEALRFFFITIFLHQHRGLENSSRSPPNTMSWKPSVEDYALFWQRGERDAQSRSSINRPNVTWSPVTGVGLKA